MDVMDNRAKERHKDVWQLCQSTLESSDPMVNKYNRSLLFVGSKQAGKSTIIHRLIDKKDQVKPTLALEYLYARKQRPNDMMKEVCNIWELGEGTIFINLLEYVITTHSIENLTIVMVLDLSNPKDLISIADSLLGTISELLDNTIRLCPENVRERLQARSVDRLKGHKDGNMIKILAVPLVIIGNKYDLFQNLESEKRKLITKYLRTFAHCHGGSLLYCTSTMDNVMARTKTYLLSHAFSSRHHTSMSISADLSRILYIPFGSDSFENIGHERPDILKKMMLHQWPIGEDDSTVVIPEDPSKDPNFVERDVDIIRSLKDRELENYKRNLELKNTISK